MTKEEILAMEAGADLNRLVAVEVMDLFCVYEPPYLAWPDREYWYDMDGRPASVGLYSMSISSAWEVVEKMPPPFQIHRCLDNTYWVIFGFDGWMTSHVEAKTAPEAICKAALLTRLEIQEREEEKL